MIHLEIPGPAMRKGRPRFDTRGRRPRAFTPKDTKVAEETIQSLWMLAGRPSLGTDPVLLTVHVVCERPRAHIARDGSLTDTGKRSLWPVRDPDLDNVVKLIQDALNGLAFADDQQIVSLHAWRSWAGPGGHPHTVVELRRAPAALAVGEAAA